MKACLTPSKAFLIDSRASNHMVASKESFTTMNITGGPIIHMGYESQIPTARRGSIKIQHDEFNNVLYAPSLATNLLSFYQMTHTSSPKRVTLDYESVEITEKDIGNLIAKGFANHASKACEFSHFLPSSHPTALLTHANNTSKLWNEIFGHLKFKYLKQLHHDKLVEGLPLIKSSEGVCPGFLVGKHPEKRYEFGRKQALPPH